MKRVISTLLALIITVIGITAFAESTPPPRPNGQNGNEPPATGEMGTPPDGFGGNEMSQPPQDKAPMGTPPDGFGGNGMGQPPQGDVPMDMPPGGFGGPGGQSSQPDSYAAVRSYTEDAEIIQETIDSVGQDENAVWVSDGTVTMTDSSLKRNSDDSAGGDSASFYGTGAAVLTTGGTVNVERCTIDTDAAGGAGVFAYGDGVAYVSDCSITTKQGASGGIHVAGGGTLYASNLTVVTDGGSAAAIRSDRGGGTLVVNGGSYTSNGSGSPAVYVTADITISDADLTATGSEALCLEGLNSVNLLNCNLTGTMPDLSQNDNTWTVILYQSMSGDAEIGEGTFLMEGGKLTSGNGGIFYTTNTDSVFTLKNVHIAAADDSEYLLRCTGNSNARGWGRAGSNGANCVFNAIGQELNGNVIYDSISNLTFSLTEGSSLTGAIIDDESCAGKGGNGQCTVTIDAASGWIVTEDSNLSVLENYGTIQDTDGNTVTIVDTDGNVLQQGNGPITITVNEYQDQEV